MGGRNCRGGSYAKAGHQDEWRKVKNEGESEKEISG